MTIALVYNVVEQYSSTVEIARLHIQIKKKTTLEQMPQIIEVTVNTYT